jgi:hypothetical protein
LVIREYGERIAAYCLLATSGLIENLVESDQSQLKRVESNKLSLTPDSVGHRIALNEGIAKLVPHSALLSSLKKQP